MLKTGITSMKVTCHHARECHAEMMEYASHIMAVYMSTPAIAQQDSVERIVKLTLLVNQRVAMEESVYLRLPTLWTLSVFVPLEGLECSVKQVGMRFIEPWIKPVDHFDNVWLLQLFHSNKK